MIKHKEASTRNRQGKQSIDTTKKKNKVRSIVQARKATVEQTAPVEVTRSNPSIKHSIDRSIDRRTIDRNKKITVEPTAPVTTRKRKPIDTNRKITVERRSSNITSNKRKSIDR